MSINLKNNINFQRITVLQYVLTINIYATDAKVKHFKILVTPANVPKLLFPQCVRRTIHILLTLFLE